MKNIRIFLSENFRFLVVNVSVYLNRHVFVMESNSWCTLILREQFLCRLDPSLVTPCPEVIKLFSCSTQLSMKFSLLINMKMPTIVGIFIFISREIFMLSMLSKKEFSSVTNLRFISRPNFMLSWVVHEKSFITPGPVSEYSKTSMTQTLMARLPWLIFSH